MKNLIALSLFVVTLLAIENSFANRSCGHIACDDIDQGSEPIRYFPSLPIDSASNGSVSPPAERLIQCVAYSDATNSQLIYGQATYDYAYANTSAIDSCTAIYGYSSNCHSYACRYVK